MTGEECRFVAGTKVLFSPLTLEGGSRSRVAAGAPTWSARPGRRSEEPGYFFFARCFEIS